MRSAVIPAQITTVEDKIAGNLNLTQVLLLIGPVFAGTMLFALVPPVMKINGVKTGLFLISFVVSVILAVRVKTRVVWEWLLIWLRFKVRPNIYIFDKNDDFLRQTEILNANKNELPKLIKETISERQKKVMTEVDQMKWQEIIEEQNNSLSFKFAQKGGLYVAVAPVKK